MPAPIFQMGKMFSGVGKRFCLKFGPRFYSSCGRKVWSKRKAKMIEMDSFAELCAASEGRAVVNETDPSTGTTTPGAAPTPSRPSAYSLVVLTTTSRLAAIRVREFTRRTLDGSTNIKVARVDNTIGFGVGCSFHLVLA